MKEASGELSMTAIAIVAIGAIAVIFTTLILPQIKKTITRNANCSQAYDCTTPDSDGKATCKYLDESGAVKTEICVVDN